jgi:hydroxymethylbilane synthase
MDIPYPLRVGTRGSILALTQTKAFCQAFTTKHPRYGAADAFALVPIKTSGDILDSEPLYDIGGKALFCKELDAAVADGTVDVAVHSLKDVPALLDERIALGAFLPRADCRDALVSRDALSLTNLPSGSRIGTCSLRRQAQLLRLRPDLTIVPLRGNVPTRLEKVRRGDLDAIIIACAGLERLELLHLATEIFTPEAMLPAGGQGIIAITHAPGAPKALVDALAAINNADAAAAAIAERAFLLGIAGTCRTPAGAYAVRTGDSLTLSVFLGTPDGQHAFRSDTSDDPAHAAAMGERLALFLLREADAPLLAMTGKA